MLYDVGMKLSQWAKLQGIKYHTAWLWVKRGKMPVPFLRTPTGTIIVQAASPDGPASGQVVLYARVSGSNQKGDLDRQVARLMEFAQKNSWVISQAVTEVGSGLNGHRPKLLRLLGDPTVKRIVVEHRDRLMRFGCEYVEASLAAQGRSLAVLHESELKDDLVQDMIEVLTSFCARLYGRRSAKNKAKRAVESLAEES